MKVRSCGVCQKSSLHVSTYYVRCNYCGHVICAGCSIGIYSCKSCGQGQYQPIRSDEE